MVKIPPLPFKLVGVGNDHPFVSEALRQRRHFEPCWCGSGRKFRKCHQLRAQQKAMPYTQLVHEQEKIFWRSRGCMHPQASKLSCGGPTIDAHSIQRKGPLARLVDNRNHVCHLIASPPDSIDLKEVGWKRASVFPGFCAQHDSTVFGPLERTAFVGSHEQCVLLTYRNICNELYRKRAFIESLVFHRDVIDRGCDFNGQLERQTSVHENIIGQTKSKEELEKLWDIFGASILRGDFERFRSKCLFFEGELSVCSSGALHAEFDFSGTQLSDTWDLTADGQMLSHSVTATDNGGAIVFTWLAEQQAPALIVESFEAFPPEDKGDIFVQYCFLNCENTYFSRAWWDSLTPEQKLQLKRYAAALYYEGGAFSANRPPLVPWLFR
jgi:hypothetical protein